MLIGARTGAWAASGGGWTNPYVTDGLVAMWDGKWDDVNLAIIDGVDWIDCVGGARLTGVSKLEVGVSVVKIAESDKIFESAVTIEHLGATSNVSRIYTISSNGIGYGYFGIKKKYRGWPSKVLKNWSANNQITIIDNGDGSQTAINTPTGTIITMSDVYDPSLVSGTVALGAGTAGVTYSPYKSIRIYNRALTADEIAANYAVDKARFGLS